LSTVVDTSRIFEALEPCGTTMMVQRRLDILLPASLRCDGFETVEDGRAAGKQPRGRRQQRRPA
jgi:hypothetical protein